MVIDWYTHKADRKKMCFFLCKNKENALLTQLNGRHQFIDAADGSAGKCGDAMNNAMLSFHTQKITQRSEFNVM